MLLKSIKENSKGVVTYVIVGLISLTFVITALYGVDFSGSSDVVAIVNDDEISQDDFRSEFNAKKRRLQQELDEKYTAEFDNALKQSTLESMINRRLLNQLASELGHATTGRELQALIHSNNVFKIDGKFSLEKYKQMLRLNGYSDTQYEAVKSTELTQSQVKYNLLNSAFVTPYALQNLSKLNNQQRKFSYIKLSADQYKGKVKVDIKSVEEYYDKQTESFFEPQKIKVDFIELSLSEIAKDMKVNDDELFNFYEDEKERFTTEEERQAQHILVESKQQAEQIIIQLNSGADFAKLAGTHSLDTGSKDAGGDLGFFTLGVMMSEFEDKVFSMKVDEVSSPVKTEFGYHVIKLNNIQTGTVKPFDEIRVELSELYTQRAAQKSLYDLTEQLTNLAYEASLEEASDQMNLKLNTSEFFAQNSTEFEPKFTSAAYSDLVLNKGENSELIELSKDKFVVLRVKDKLAERQKLFDEVKGEINTHLTTLLSKTFIDNVAKQITEALTKGDNKTAQVLMDKNQLKWKEVGWVKRDSIKADVAIVNQVFALPKPANATTYSAQSLNKSQSIVIALSKVKTTDDTSTKALERSLLNFESDAMFNGILTTLRKNADLEIFTERL
ncbi:MAG TPA: peptidylprolyl isomerase [Gammaproteobacteria bacterium]|nr:peptidylprolyl isomerase [Gammaproteobacteria bacterium]